MRILALSLLLAFLVTACGTKGPLYLPEKRYPQKAPVEQQEKATDNKTRDTRPTQESQETQ